MDIYKTDTIYESLEHKSREDTHTHTQTHTQTNIMNNKHVTIIKDSVTK